MNKKIIKMQLTKMVQKENKKRKIIVLSFITLDGIIQAPGAPKEDISGNFVMGGWSVNYFDAKLGDIMVEQMSKPFDLLLGRKTFDIFASHWPFIDVKTDPISNSINKAKKYVVSKSEKSLSWDNSFLITGDIVQEILKLQEKDGPDLQVHGSGELIQTLFAHNLIDEIWLKIFPIVLGSGKKLFGNMKLPESFKLIKSEITPLGVIVANYRFDGKVIPGSFALEKNE